jgi:hypothetical protein
MTVRTDPNGTRFYSGAGERFRFLRVGTLDDPDRFPPEIHIFSPPRGNPG